MLLLPVSWMWERLAVWRCVHVGAAGLFNGRLSPPSCPQVLPGSRSVAAVWRLVGLRSWWTTSWGGFLKQLPRGRSRWIESKSFKVFNASKTAADWIGIKESVEQKTKAWDALGMYSQSVRGRICRSALRWRWAASAERWWRWLFAVGAFAQGNLSYSLNIWILPYEDGSFNCAQHHPTCHGCTLGFTPVKE